MADKHQMNLSRGIAKQALDICVKLHKKGFLAYFAGGSVRDFLMKNPAQDFDIATTAKPEEVEAMFEKTVPVGKQFGVILVVIDGKPFEVATFRREGKYEDGRHPSEVSFTDPKEDALRRDFTVNGLFYDPIKHEVLDFVEGAKDIQKKVIRCIGDPVRRFDEDKLRLLRAVRFACNLDFDIEEETFKVIKSKAHEIHQVSQERIRDELIKIFTRKGAGRGYVLLSETGLMQEILPEIEKFKGVEQPPEFHPEGDVFIHTKLLLDQLEKPSAVLAFSALLHDVAKPQTFQVRDGRITFYEHAPQSAQMAREILKRLRFSNDVIDDVAECIENHMKFGDVRKMRSGKLKRFVARPTFDEEMELHRIDCVASHGMLDNYEFLEKKLMEYEKEDLKPKPFVNGHDLIALGMEPGPPMKSLLDDLYEMQLEGQFGAREEALKQAKVKVHEMKGSEGKADA